MKIKRLKAEFNNVQFVPPKEKIWYRQWIKCGKHNNKRYVASWLKIGPWLIHVHYFTSDNNIEGYGCTLYLNGQLEAYIDLMSELAGEGKYIRAKNIASAEKQAKAWADDLYGEPHLP